MNKGIIPRLTFILMPAIINSAVASKTIFLDQGWNERTRAQFYHLSQGSQMMPYEWFLSLERKKNTELFIKDGLARFGYIPGSKSRKNPDMLPIGFARDKSRNGHWVGMTCAACHVSQIRFRGINIQIDGGPAKVDFSRLIKALDLAMVATLKDKVKFERFANKVHAHSKNKLFNTKLLKRWAAKRTPNKQSLKLKLKQFSRKWSLYVEQSRSNTQWGPGRNDAFNMIFNKLGALNLGIAKNSVRPDAPVNYPQLWGASYHNKVQWNGSVKNTEPFARLGRNVAQVLGVFGNVRLEKTNFARRYYISSIRRINLLRLEASIRTLYSPVWPQQLFGPINKVTAAKGKMLYQQHCASCHKVISRRAQHRNIKIRMIPVHKVGTDPVMANSVCKRTTLTGRLSGSRLLFSRKLLPREKSVNFLTHVVAGTLSGPRVSIKHFSVKTRNKPHHSMKFKAGARRYLKQQTLALDCGKHSEIMAYKARPLEGIWATYPYLHNGSVKSLYELLLPSHQRAKTFIISDNSFDHKNVGVLNIIKTVTQKKSWFIFDTSIPGNSNAGHNYGTNTFSEKQRRQIVEYLKTL